MLGIEINPKMGIHLKDMANSWSRNICELVFKQDEDLVLIVFGKLYPVAMSYSDGAHTSWVENTGRVGLTEAGREIRNGKQWTNMHELC